MNFATSHAGGIDCEWLQIRAQRKQKQPEHEGQVGGDIEAVAAPETADQYVIVKKKSNGNGNGNGEQQ